MIELTDTHVPQNCVVDCLKDETVSASESTYSGPPKSQADDHHYMVKNTFLHVDEMLDDQCEMVRRHSEPMPDINCHQFFSHEPQKFRRSAAMQSNLKLTDKTFSFEEADGTSVSCSWSSRTPLERIPSKSSNPDAISRLESMPEAQSDFQRMSSTWTMDLEAYARSIEGTLHGENSQSRYSPLGSNSTLPPMEGYATAPKAFSNQSPLYPHPNSPQPTLHRPYPMGPSLHAYDPQPHGYDPHPLAHERVYPKSVARQTHAYDPQAHAYDPRVHAYDPQAHAYDPRVHAYDPRVYVQPHTSWAQPQESYQEYYQARESWHGSHELSASGYACPISTQQTPGTPTPSLRGSVISDSGVDAARPWQKDVLIRMPNWSKKERTPPGEKFLCTFLIGMRGDALFKVSKRLIGRQGENMKFISSICPGTKVRLRGHGSGYREIDTNVESNIALQINVSSPDRAEYEYAKRELSSLLRVVYDEYKKRCGIDVRVKLMEHPRNPKPKR